VSAAHQGRARYERVVRRALAVVALTLLPSVARAEPPALIAPRDPLERFAGNLALFALSGATALAGFSRRPPLSLVMVAWPTIAREEDGTAATWTRPAGGRRPMFYATFIDVRF